MESLPTTTSDAGSPEVRPVATRFVLEFAPGVVEHLDGAILVGRAPSVRRAPGPGSSRSVTLEQAHADISRTHVRIELLDDEVLVTDMHSSSGTLQFSPDFGPQQSRAGEPTAVTPGTVIALGDSTTIVVRAVV